MPITFELLPAATEEIIDRLDAIEKLLMKKPDPEPQPDGFITRKQVCELLKISLPTLHSWTRQNKLTCYHIGGRSLYRESEVLEAVQPVNYGLKKKGGTK